MNMRNDLIWRQSVIELIDDLMKSPYANCPQFGAEIAYNSTNNRVDMVRFLWRGMMQGKFRKQSGR